MSEIDAVGGKVPKHPGVGIGILIFRYRLIAWNHPAAAWKTKPSWGVVALADKIINPDLEKWYYIRAHSHMIEIAGASHSVYESHPKEVAAVIEEAAKKSQD
jgi:pimeloyl-ACP methyl ester carboxylesterase